MAELGCSWLGPHGHAASPSCAAASRLLSTRCSRRLAGCSSVSAALPGPEFRCVQGRGVRERGGHSRVWSGEVTTRCWVHVGARLSATQNDFPFCPCCLSALGIWVIRGFPSQGSELSGAQGRCSIFFCLYPMGPSTLLTQSGCGEEDILLGRAAPPVASELFSHLCAVLGETLQICFIWGSFLS